MNAKAAAIISRACPASPNISEKRNGKVTMANGAIKDNSKQTIAV